MWLNKEQRLASETQSIEVRETSLLQDLDVHRQQRARQLQTPLFQQPIVDVMIAKFHSHLTDLLVSRCSTCLETFLGLKMKKLLMHISGSVYVAAWISTILSFIPLPTTWVLAQFLFSYR